MQWARETLGVDLEIDKQYRYVVFSDLKKNYLGVLSDGTVDVKGLTGKKSHTPPFIRKAFYDTLEILEKSGGIKILNLLKNKLRTLFKKMPRTWKHTRFQLKNSASTSPSINHWVRMARRRARKRWTATAVTSTKAFHNISRLRRCWWTQTNARFEPVTSFHM